MKPINSITKVLSSLIILFLFASCNSVQMTNQEARTLVVNSLKLPQAFRHDVDGESIANPDRDILAANNFINKEGGSWGSYTISPTEIGKQYYLGVMGKTSGGFKILGFKTYDVDIDQITGVSVNKDDLTATVRFTLKLLNVTPIASLLEPKVRNITGPINGELTFKKFDNGWQLFQDQNLPPAELLKRFL